MAYCIQCGKELHNNAQFCFHCGAGVPSNGQTSAASELITQLESDPSQLTQHQAHKPQEKTKKKSTTRIVGYSIYFLVTSLVIGLLLFSVFYAIGPRKMDAKERAKEEVEAAWQQFDENMELVSITYNTVKWDTYDKAEIDSYIAKYGNTAITDVNGTKYDTYWDYWNSKDYNPHTDTYRIFTIKGNYHVTDNRKQDYKGYYCVTVLHIVNENTWRIQETELELPDELKQLLPN